MRTKIKLDPAVHKVIVQYWNSINKWAVNGTAPQNRKLSVKEGAKISMDREELFEWARNITPVILAIRKSGSIPSIRRIDPSRDFEIRNLIIVTTTVQKVLPVSTQILTGYKEKKEVLQEPRETESWLKKLFKFKA